MFVNISALLFSGKTNSIYFSREYYQENSCAMDLKAYPFDTQARSGMHILQIPLLLPIFQICDIVLMSSSREPNITTTLRLVVTNDIN